MSTERVAPVVVGLVGRAGSGKSSFAQALRERGAVVLEADRFGHRVTDTDPEVRAALVAEYGPTVYRPDGTLDRPQVAARVFRDAAARRRLDALVHPKLVAALRAEIARRRAERSAPLVLVDAALMLEWGLERDCDHVVAVVAPEALQIERLRRARGWSAAEARRRLAAQRSNEGFAQRADVVVVNDGALDALRARAAELFERWAGRGASEA
jgi:dephospho-CoA kinase